MKILLLQDTRTGINYNTIIGHKFKAKQGEAFVKKLWLYDEMDNMRKQKVRVRVKIITTSSIQVEVF